MNAPSQTLQLVPASERSLRIWSIAGGLAAAALILAGIGAVQKRASGPAPAPIEELSEVVLPLETPPPRPRTEEPTPVLTTNLLPVEAERTDSSVKLPVVPIIPDTVPVVTAVPRLDLPAAAFKPAGSTPEFEQRHIFSRSEVDQRAVAILRVSPFLNPAMMRGVTRLQAGFILVVNQDGSVENVHLVQSTGREMLDKACLEALRQWEFSPGIRKGKKVRQWANQAFLLTNEGGGSSFEAH